LAAGPTAGAIRSTDPVAVIRWRGGGRKWLRIRRWGEKKGREVRQGREGREGGKKGMGRGGLQSEVMSTKAESKQ